MRGYFYVAIPYDLLELILPLGIAEKLKPVSRLQRGPVENEDSTFIFVVTREGGPVDRRLDVAGEIDAAGIRKRQKAAGRINSRYRVPW